MTLLIMYLTYFASNFKDFDMNNSEKQPQKSFFSGFPKVRWRYAHWYLLTAQAVTLHIWLTIFYFSGTYSVDPTCGIERLSPMDMNCRPWESSEPFVIPEPTDCLLSPARSCEHTLPPPPPPKFIKLKNPPVEHHAPPPPPKPTSGLEKPIVN